MIQRKDTFANYIWRDVTVWGHICRISVYDSNTPGLKNWVLTNVCDKARFERISIKKGFAATFKWHPKLVKIRNQFAHTCIVKTWLKFLTNLQHSDNFKSWLEILSMFHVQAILLLPRKWVRNFNSLSTSLQNLRKVEDWSIISAQFFMLQLHRNLVVYPLEYIILIQQTPFSIICFSLFHVTYIWRLVVLNPTLKGHGHSWLNHLKSFELKKFATRGRFHGISLWREQNSFSLRVLGSTTSTVVQERGQEL